MTLTDLSARLSEHLGRQMSVDSTRLLVTECWGGMLLEGSPDAFTQDQIVLTCDPGEPTAPRWASYAIFRAGGPVAQDEVLEFMDGLPCGRPTSMANVWSVLSAHPMVAKTQSQPSSIWVWLPHLGLTPPTHAGSDQTLRGTGHPGGRDVHRRPLPRCRPFRARQRGPELASQARPQTEGARKHRRVGLRDLDHHSG
jgi:hypothetical protein